MNGKDEVMNNTEQLAREIAICVFPGPEDEDRFYLLIDLLNKFASEVKRSAIEP